MDKKNTAKIKKIKHHLPMFDIPFFVGVMLLLCIGLIMLFSAGYADAFNKLTGIVIITYANNSFLQSSELRL